MDIKISSTMLQFIAKDGLATGAGGMRHTSVR